MEIYSTFTGDNFNLKKAQWFPSSWDYDREIPKLKNEEWDCYGERDLDLSSLIKSKGTNTNLFISGIYCYIDSEKKFFKSICLVITQFDSSDSEWKFRNEKLIAKGAKILDYDTSSAYSEEEAFIEFYNSGYEMGASWFNDDNLAGAKEAYQDYLASGDKGHKKLSYVEWLIHESEYQLETSEDQFSEPEYIWSPRDKYYKFLDWDDMGGEYYRGSAAAFEHHITLLEQSIENECK